MITRREIDPRDVLNVLRSRWPDVVVKDLQQEEPTWAMLAAGRWSEWSLVERPGERPAMLTFLMRLLGHVANSLAAPANDQGRQHDRRDL